MLVGGPLGGGGDGFKKFDVLIPDNVCLSLTVLPRVAYSRKERVVCEGLGGVIEEIKKWCWH